MIMKEIKNGMNVLFNPYYWIVVIGGGFLSASIPNSNVVNYIIGIIIGVLVCTICNLEKDS